MTTAEMRLIYNAVTTFRVHPNPDSAEALLCVLSKHRRGNQAIQGIIDQVLEYVFLVGLIIPAKEVEPLENAVLYTQP